MPPWRATTADPTTRPLRVKAHPVTWFGPVGGSVVVMAAWAGVSHSSGSGWVQAVGALLLSILLVGMVAPYFFARRTGAVCTAAPADCRAGQPVTLTLAVTGPLRIRPLGPLGPVARAVGRVRGPRTVEVEVTPAHRGILESVAVELATCAPFGLLWWAKEVAVPLGHALHVAPRTGRPTGTEFEPGPGAGESPPARPGGRGASHAACDRTRRVIPAGSCTGRQLPTPAR